MNFRILSPIIPFVILTVLASPLASGLGFLDQYSRVTLSSWDPDNGAHVGFYESEVIEFPSAEGNRLVFARVSLTPFQDPPSTELPFPEAPPELLEVFTVFAEIVYPNGSELFPVEFQNGILEGAAMDVPESALGLRLLVMSPDPQLTFYTEAAADVVINAIEVFQFLQADVDQLRFFFLQEAPPGRDRAEVLAQLADARSAIARSRAIYQDDLQKARQAEKIAKRAKAAFDANRFSKAGKLLKQANEKLGEARDSLARAEDILVDALIAILDLPEAAGLRAEINRMRSHFRATDWVVEAQFFFWLHTFVDLPFIPINVYAPSTNYSPAAMKINLMAGHESDPSVVMHELAHAIINKATSFSQPAAPHDPELPSSQPLAWNEGWATFFAQAVLADPNYEDTTIRGGLGLRQNLENRTVDGTAVTATGPSVEANIQAVLWDIFDGPANAISDQDDDGLSVPFSTIWDCVKNGGGSFNGFLACLRPKLTEKERQALDRILKMNGII